MRVYFIPRTDFGDGLEPDDGLARTLEGAFRVWFHKRGLDDRTCAEWYFDEFEDPTESGVAVEIFDTSAELAHRIILSLEQDFSEFCDQLEVQHTK